MKKVIFKSDFPKLNSKYIYKDNNILKFTNSLEIYKNDYYELINNIVLIPIKILDIKEVDENRVRKIVTSKLIKNLIQSINSYHSTIGTQAIEGNEISIIGLEDYAFKSNKMKQNIEKDISFNLKKLYENYKLDLNRFSLDELKKLHKIIYRKQKEIHPGVIRKSGDSNLQIPSAEKTFLDSSIVKKYIDKFIVYVNSQDLNFEPIIKGAMIHAILVGIHPFKDGNGRISRFISDKYISHKYNVPLFLSEAIFKNSDQTYIYHKNLDYFHLELDPYPFINYVINLSIDQINNNINYLKDFQNTLIKNLKAFSKRLDIKINYIIILSLEFSANNLFSVSRLEKCLNVTTMTARDILKKLEDNNLCEYYKKIGRFNVYRFNITNK